MNFIKRAWLSLIAKKGRTALLAVITSAIMLFVLAGLLINNAADTSIKNAKANVGATLTLSANRQAAFKKIQSSSSSSSKPTLKMSSVKLSDAKKIAKLSGVSSYNASATASVNASSFSAISTSSSSSSSPMGSSSSSSSGSISISGVTNTATATTFTDGTNKITKGRGITASDKGTNNVVIESELAKQDKISVGDKITVKSTSGSTSYKLKVVGIYKSTSSSSTQTGPGASDPANTIFGSYTLANTIKGSKYANTADSVTFQISTPSKIKQVKASGTKLINKSKYTLATNDSSYQTVKSAMSSVKSFSSKIVWLVSIAGTIILTLIVILMVRERRHEIGILLSMGEKRWKIIGQLFIEMVMILVVALAVAGVGGKFVGDKLGSQLVTSQSSSSAGNISAPGDQKMQMSGKPSSSGGGTMSGSGGSTSTGGMGSAQTSSSSSASEDIDVNLSMLEMVELGGFGLAIMFLSVLIASGGILRLQPKKVLID